ncbi:MAG: UDP-N-acetylmuramate--L-alanine ligase [Acidimicrobiia bacterium]
MVNTATGPIEGVSSVHLVGVGGAGMSALAKLLIQSGLDVSGSDLRDSLDLKTLGDLGVVTWSGHRPEKIGAIDLVVASSAIPERDPELEWARDNDIRVWRRPQLLNALTATWPTIGPTGTHGKTTTTAMLVIASQATGRDPSFVVGGEMIDLGTNAHRGKDSLLILEIDEAFGTFKQISLSGLVVTSVEPEHLDYFETASRMEAAYVEVAAGVDGPVVCCIDDLGSARVLASVKDRARVIGYGFNNAADWQIVDLVESADSVAFGLRWDGNGIAVSIPRPGRHIAANAAGAIALLTELGHDPAQAAQGLGQFHGVKRRFENRGTVAGVTMIDDYAHHPTEVKTMVRVAMARGHRRVVAVFQPHLFSRTELFHREFGEALAGADRVVVTDVYAAREAPIPGITGELIATAARQAGADVVYAPHRADLASLLAGLVMPGDLVLTMGAGDITLVPTELGHLLEARDAG